MPHTAPTDPISNAGKITLKDDKLISQFLSRASDQPQIKNDTIIPKNLSGVSRYEKNNDGVINNHKINTPQIFVVASLEVIGAPFFDANLATIKS